MLRIDEQDVKRDNIRLNPTQLKPLFMDVFFLFISLIVDNVGKH